MKRLLSHSPLVTLTGVGGTGKTRLALRVANDLRRAFADGVWLVDLTDLRAAGALAAQAHDQDVLAYLVAATLNVREQSGSPLRNLIEQLADRHMLLVLDNCEHLLPGSAMLANALMHGCPRLRILATSRESLAVAGETVFSVPPLGIPDADRWTSLAEVSRSEAVALFVARAQVAAPGFRITSENHRAVAALVHRIEGLPLAIELAAARVGVWSPEQILHRLADRFALLHGRGAGVPDRQETLRACVDWSFERCDKPERLLWARLAVFSGGFELDAVEGVCADDALAEPDLLDLLSSLIDKSVIVRDDHGDPARYRMLETIRDYGAEQLAAAGEDALLRRRHRDWYQGLVARAAAEFISERGGYWLARLTVEHANLRTAIEYCLAEPGEAKVALQIMGSLPILYWRLRGVFGEGRLWLDRALDQQPEETPLRARALLLAGHLRTAQGELDVAMRLLDEGWRLAERLGALPEQALALLVRGIGTMFRDDLRAAMELYEQGLSLLAGAWEANLDFYLDLLNVDAVTAALAGDQARAAARVATMLAITEPREEGFYRSRAAWIQGLCRWLLGDPRQAVAHVRDSMRLKQSQRSNDWFGMALCFEVLAWSAGTLDAHSRAATLLGAAQRVWTMIGTPMASLKHMSGHHDACVRKARDALGTATFDEAFARGRDLSHDDALAYALGEG